MNPKGFSKNAIVGEKMLKRMRKQASYIEEDQITPTKTEVKLLNTNIVEKYPLQLGVNILAESKILLNSFVAFLAKFTRPKSFKIIYCGMFAIKLLSISYEVMTLLKSADTSQKLTLTLRHRLRVYHDDREDVG